MGNQTDRQIQKVTRQTETEGEIQLYYVLVPHNVKRKCNNYK